MSTAQLSRQLCSRGRASQLSARKVAAAPRAGNAGCQPASSHSSSAALSARSPAFSVRQLQAGATPRYLAIQSSQQLLVQHAAGPKGLLWPASTGRVELAKRGSSAGRFSFIGTVSSTDMSRATDSREAGRMGIFGSALSYGGSYGRVTNEAIGRDVSRHSTVLRSP